MSLQPLEFEEAVAGLLQVKPLPKRKKGTKGQITTELEKPVTKEPLGSPSGGEG